MDVNDALVCHLCIMHIQSLLELVQIVRFSFPVFYIWPVWVQITFSVAWLFNFSCPFCELLSIDIQMFWSCGNAAEVNAYHPTLPTSSCHCPRVPAIAIALWSTVGLSPFLGIIDRKV